MAFYAFSKIIISLIVLRESHSIFFHLYSLNYVDNMPKYKCKILNKIYPQDYNQTINQRNDYPESSSKVAKFSSKHKVNLNYFIRF